FCNLLSNCFACLLSLKFKSLGAINFVFSSIVDLLIAPKHNTVTVTAEIVAMIVNDNAFFFILCMIDYVNTTSVIDTFPFFERFNVLNISETELRSEERRVGKE